MYAYCHEKGEKSSTSQMWHSRAKLLGKGWEKRGDVSTGLWVIQEEALGSQTMATLSKEQTLWEGIRALRENYQKLISFENAMMEPDTVRANLKFQKDISGAHSCVDGLTNHVQTWEMAEPPLGVKKQLRELVLQSSVTDSVPALLMLASALGSLCYGLAQVDLL